MPVHAPRRLAVPTLLLAAALLLALPACSTLGGTTDDDDDRPPPAEEPTEMPQPDEPEEPSEPEEQAPRTVQGYRIQILKTDDKDAADQRAAEAESTWSQPVEVDWRAPYYSVRVGAFGSRSSAEAILSAVQERYPDAFLVPDTVTIYPN